MNSKLESRVLMFLKKASEDSEVRKYVEANHDNNEWWPKYITDYRVRLLAAGWCTRISYRSVKSYSKIIAEVDRLGFDAITEMSDEEVGKIIKPIGLLKSRLIYLSSLNEFLIRNHNFDLLSEDVDEFIAHFAGEVAQASYKVSQCAALYTRGYHCGVMPVDSGMVSKLAPKIGLALSKKSYAHEEMRQFLEDVVRKNSVQIHELISNEKYDVQIPKNCDPTWWSHLVLIYFKRVFCNGPSPRLCVKVPTCNKIIDCSCT